MTEKQKIKCPLCKKQTLIKKYFVKGIEYYYQCDCCGLIMGDNNIMNSNIPILEETKIINSNNSIHLNWNYSKDIPIPLDGKKRWIAYHSINENINSIKEISCSQDIIPTITDTIRYYAWTDEKLEMPKYPIELKN